MTPRALTQTPTESNPSEAPRFADTKFSSALLQAMQQTIGRYVRHDDSCGVVNCSCGLTADIPRMITQDVLLKRYGTEALFQDIKKTVDRYVRHDAGCEPIREGRECSCGLTAAIGGVERRTILVKRYGVDG